MFSLSLSSLQSSWKRVIKYSKIGDMSDMSYKFIKHSMYWGKKKRLTELQWSAEGCRIPLKAQPQSIGKEDGKSF